MKTMNISINDELHSFALRDMHRAGFDNASEYIRALIRQRREAEVEKDVRFLQAASAGAPEADPGPEVEALINRVKREVRAGRKAGK